MTLIQYYIKGKTNIFPSTNKCVIGQVRSPPSLMTVTTEISRKKKIKGKYTNK